MQSYHDRPLTEGETVRREHLAAEEAAKQREVERKRTLAQRVEETERKNAAERQQREADRLAAVTADLKARYMVTTGATEESFAAALPELLEQHRRDEMGKEEDEIRSLRASYAF